MLILPQSYKRLLWKLLAYPAKVRLLFLSVLLETEWVLRYTYKLSTSIILDAFEKLMGLSHLTVEDPNCILQALQWYREKFDFADALHLASCKKTNKFATFDKGFIKKAKKFNVKLVTF